MRNEEKFRTPKDRQSAFKAFCANHECESCPCKKEGCDLEECRFSWLAIDVASTKPYLPFRVEKSSSPRYEYAVVGTISREEIMNGDSNFHLEQVCSSLNSAATAWHEWKMAKERK